MPSSTTALINPSGWSVNYSQMHDSPTYFVGDAELLFAVAEARISWLKHGERFSQNPVREAEL
jgi:hypothetical protein